MSALIERAESLAREAKAKREEAATLAAQDSMTTDEAATFDALVADADTLDAEAKAIRERDAKVKANATALGGYTQTTSRRTANVALTSDQKVNAVDDPKKGFKNPRDFLMSVMKVERGAKDDRLNILAAAGSDEHSTFSDPYGGYLVPEGLVPGLLTRMAEADPIGALTRKVPMQAPSIKLNARVDSDHSSSVSGGLRVYRRAEADTVSSSRMTMSQINLEANGLMGLAYATDEILTDSPISFVSLLAQGFADEFGAVKLQERLNGTGAGQFLGVNNSGALITVSKETGQAASTIVYENVIKMRARCYGYGNAVWLANHDCIPQLMLLNQSVGTGGIPVWQPDARSDHPDMLLGRPIYFSEFPNSVGTAGDLLLCDWSQYLEGSYGPFEQAQSIHVRFVNKESAFRFFERCDARPWWSAALTPKNGSTLSPFVRLATRS